MPAEMRIWSSAYQSGPNLYVPFGSPGGDVRSSQVGLYRRGRRLRYAATGFVALLDGNRGGRVASVGSGVESNNDDTERSQGLSFRSPATRIGVDHLSFISSREGRRGRPISSRISSLPNFSLSSSVLLQKIAAPMRSTSASDRSLLS